MFQEIWFNQLGYWQYYNDRAAWNTNALATLRKNNRVHVMIVNRQEQGQLYAQFIKAHPDVVVLYQSPDAINCNYGNDPRNFVVVWEFVQPTVSTNGVSPQ